MKLMLGASFLAVAASAATLQEPPAAPAAGAYLGKRVCADCHEDRVSQHKGSNFDRSWRPASDLPETAFPLEFREGALIGRVEKVADGWVYRLRLGERPWQTFPVHSVIGGRRFGLSFLLEVKEVEARPLSRTTLVEARYMFDAASGRLKLSPGFPAEEPRSYETAVGRVLNPEFAEKCLDCHGGVLDSTVAKAGGPHPVYRDPGVGCERCHGPGADHLAALEAGAEEPAIINPAKLAPAEAMRLCGRCHSGFFPVARPRPKDLMISNQATALASSDCYQVSGGAFSCVACHDPHGNATSDDPAYESACRSCHGVTGKFPKTCPVNAESGCVGCHMPEVVLTGGFPVTDHWIRVVQK